MNRLVPHYVNQWNTFIGSLTIQFAQRAAIRASVFEHVVIFTTTFNTLKPVNALHH